MIWPDFVKAGPRKPAPGGRWGGGGGKVGAGSAGSCRLQRHTKGPPGSRLRSTAWRGGGGGGGGGARPVTCV